MKKTLRRSHKWKNTPTAPAVQYHPEASPGPHDARYLFHDFITLMLATKK
jgi:carbamoyl-phosphate synthase small subunit